MEVTKAFLVWTDDINQSVSILLKNGMFFFFSMNLFVRSKSELINFVCEIILVRECPYV